MSNHISAVPASLPPDLYTAASAPVPVNNVRRTDSISSQSSGRIPPQVPPKIQQTPIRTDFTGGSQTGPDGWDITPQDKAAFDAAFKGIDTTNKGYIDGKTYNGRRVIVGNEAVAFFLTSKLPEDLLAHIWDLSDIQKEGRLNRDTFAVAMYLIRLKISGKDLPATLPTSLVPPSLRQVTPTAAVQPSGLQQAQRSSAAQDLFGLEDVFTAPAPQPGSPAPAFTVSPPRTMTPVHAAAVPSPKPSSPVISTPLHRSFKPQSDFGRGIASPSIAQVTPPPPPAQSFTLSSRPGSQFNPLPLAPVQVPMQSGSVFGDQDRDLLGDPDPEINQRLTVETAELANLSNQIGSLNTATRDLQTNKARAETELASVSQQKRDIEARLKQIRGLYDAEVANVKAVEGQLAAVRGELGKNRQELTILEASLSALQTQMNEQKGMLSKDQAENQALKARMVGLGEEIKGLKEALEKVKREARQQRGMVAINKKQLSTMEGEKERVSSELAEEKTGLEAMMAEQNAANAVQHPQREIGSPGRTGTNPFLRMQSSPFAQPATFSPPPQQSFSPPPQQSFSPQPLQPQFSPPQQYTPFHEGAFASAFDDAFPSPSSPSLAEVTPTPVSQTHKPEAKSVPETRESILEQTSPPSIASALSPPLAARDSPTYAESATSSLVVNASRSAVESVTSGPEEHLSSKQEVLPTTEVVSTSPAPMPPTHEAPVRSNVEDKEVNGNDEDIEEPVTQTMQPIDMKSIAPVHGPRSADAITSPDIVQETLSQRPRDEDLALASPILQTPDFTQRHEPTHEPTKPEEQFDEGEIKGVALPGGFPSESSDEGRESWVDLGEESKSLPSEQHPPSAITDDLPPNRSDPFAFSTVSSGPLKVATKEDFDAAFSSFGSFGKKEENGEFTRDFNSEFPPIQEYGGDDSESDEETGGFHDNFAEKGEDTADTSGFATGMGKSIETPLQETLPIAPTAETIVNFPPSTTLDDATKQLTDAPPPVPPKDTFLSSEEGSAPMFTPGGTPPEETGRNPPAYSRYENVAETSSGSNNLSGLLPTRGEPHSSAAPYTSPPPTDTFSTPAPFVPVEAVLFSPPPLHRPLFDSAPIHTQSAPEISEPQSSTPVVHFPTLNTSPPTPPPKEEPTKQSFAAFDFSGLQDAAPLDESQYDPFRLSARSDAFGEFDTSFDSMPVTPAKPIITPPNNNEFDNFDWDTPADFSQVKPVRQATPAGPGTVLPSSAVLGSSALSSDFDDVFASFDRPTTIAPPELPARKNSSSDDDPNLKTLTGTNPLFANVDGRNGVFEVKGC